MLGSASVSVHLSGAVTASQLYSPYGSVRYASGILPTDYGFTHQRADATSGLDDDGARWYDPVAGQFASADTTLAGGLNRYAYVAGNPETATDPSGHVYIENGTEVNGLPDVGPTDTGTPGINLGPLIGGIGATFAAFGLWVHSQFASSSSAHKSSAHKSSAHTQAQSQPNAMADARHQTNALDAAQIASGGGGGGGGGSGSGGDGSGTVPRTPPPTENGEAIGFGAPILSEDVLAECDPQLPTAQYCIGWTRYGIVVPDPQPQYKANGKPNRGPGAFINAMDANGNVETYPAGPGVGVHAEDNAQAAVPGGRMSRAMGWRSVNGELVWKEIPVCIACQAKYPPNLFPPGVQPEPGGAWSYNYGIW